jgi:hypothetical protein
VIIFFELKHVQFILIGPPILCKAKYTSRAADLYRQLLAKEVAKSSPEDGNNGWSSSPISASQGPNQTAAFPDLKPTEASKENASEKTEPVRSPRAPTHSFKKPIGGKKPGNKTGGLEVRKLTSKVCFMPCMMACLLHYLESSLQHFGCLCHSHLGRYQINRSNCTLNFKSFFGCDVFH